MRRFTQVDVFADALMFGNPVAVVHDAAELTSQQMAEFASWTTDGLVRQAAYKGLDREKDPHAVHREIAR